MNTENIMTLIIPARSENESFARVTVGAFAARLDPTLEELADIKTAVSEAVTNAIVHAYADKKGEIFIRAQVKEDVLTVEIIDEGRGIENVPQALEPFFTTLGEEERSGMGFTVMQNFMDELQVLSAPAQGTTVRMTKKIGGKA